MDAAQAALDEANRLRSLGRFEEALLEYDRADSLHNRVHRNAGYLVQRGATLVGLDRIEEGLACFNKALKRDPQNAPAWFKKGSAHKRLRQYPDAVEAFRKASFHAPDLDQAHVNLVRTLLLAKDYESAIEAAQAAYPHLQIAKARLTLDKLQVLAFAKLRHEADAADPARRLAKAFHKDERVLDAEMRMLVSRALLHAATTGDADYDLNLVKLACTVEASFESVLRLGITALAARNDTAARHALLLASRIDEDDWRPFYHLGVMDFQAGRFRKAAARLQYALDLASAPSPPNSPTRRGSLESYTSHASSRFGEAIRKEGRGRIMNRLQLGLAAALFNGGASMAAKLAIMSSAHSQGSLRNHARVLLAAMELREGALVKAMHSLNVARKEVDEAVFEHRPRTASAQYSARFVNYDLMENAPPNDGVVTRVVRLHLLTAKLARVAREKLESNSLRTANGNFTSQGDLFGSGGSEPRGWANPSPSKLLELEQVCLQDVLRRDSNNKEAVDLLKTIQDVKPETAASPPPPSSTVPSGKESAVAPTTKSGTKPPPLVRTQSCGLPGKTSPTSAAAMTSAEKLQFYAEQDAKRQAFLNKLQARRRAVEHDMADHSYLDDSSGNESDF